jgi:uncharacterized protein (UPF0261 family)
MTHENERCRGKRPLARVRFSIAISGRPAGRPYNIGYFRDRKVEEMPEIIALLGTLDTKGDQIEYLKQQIENRGLETAVIDVGVLGKTPFHPTFSREQVAMAAGSSLNDAVALHDGRAALKLMAKGAFEIVRSLCAEGKLAGLIAVGGSQGTALALEVIKAVPLGIPKFLVTTVAYSQLITPDMVSGDDVMMIPWTAGLWGLNSMSRRVMEAAAGAVAGAAAACAQSKESPKKVAGITSLGSSINKYMHHLKPALEDRGYEVAVFHVTGMSGRMFERAIADGLIAVSLDLAAGIELLNTITDGACSAGVHRLEAACRMGIPQIVSPGAIEAFHWGMDRPFPDRYKDRPRHQHSELILTVRSRVEEIRAASRLMAEKLNAAKGPTAVVLPMRGMIGTGDDPGQHAHMPPLEGLAKFREDLMSITLPGMKAFRETLIGYLKPDVQVETLNVGFNDPPYAETVLKLFDEMIARS